MERASKRQRVGATATTAHSTRAKASTSQSTRAAIPAEQARRLGAAAASSSKTNKDKAQAQGHGQGIPALGRFLASSDKDVRDKAVHSIRRFLSAAPKPTKASKRKASDEAASDDDDDAKGEAQEDGEDDEMDMGDWDDASLGTGEKRLSELELDKLWKGLYYCFWMSDKPLVQQALADELASLVLCVRPSRRSSGAHTQVARFRSALAFVSAFWRCLLREWAALDRLRLDKFYMLVRRFVRASFRLLATVGWHERAIEEHNAMLLAGPLSVGKAQTPVSLTYHLCDVYLAELSGALSEQDDTTKAPPVVRLLEPFIETMARAPSSTLFDRVRDAVLKPLLPLPVAWTVPSYERDALETGSEIARHSAEERDEGNDDDDDDDGRLLRALIAKAMWDKAAQRETPDHLRRRMFELWRERGGDADDE